MSPPGNAFSGASAAGTGDQMRFSPPPIITTYAADSIVYRIIEKFNNRARDGLEKYGTTLDRTDLSTHDWIQHAQEELMDAILYLEKLKHTIECKGGEIPPL